MCLHRLSEHLDFSARAPVDPGCRKSSCLHDGIKTVSLKVNDHIVSTLSKQLATCYLLLLVACCSLCRCCFYFALERIWLLVLSVANLPCCGWVGKSKIAQYSRYWDARMYVECTSSRIVQCCTNTQLVMSLIWVLGRF